MLNAIIFVLVGLLLIYLSLSMRVRKIQAWRSKKKSYEEIASPLGQAIKDFVAVAGGVYLGLMALAEFLKVPAPVKGQLWGISFDPIAIIAVLLAIVAPLFPGKEQL